MNNTQCQFLQYKLQSGHCFLEEGFAKLEDLRVAHVGDQLLRLFAELMNLFGLIQVLQERLLVRVILELLNQLFNRFFAIRVLLLDCRMECAWYSIVNVAAAGFPTNFPIRFGGQRIFLLLAHVDPVVHFASSASV